MRTRSALFVLALLIPAAVRAAPPEIRVSNAAVVEGDHGETSAVFWVTLSSMPGATVTVDYQTVGCTATGAGVDFDGAAGRLTFAPFEPLGRAVPVTVHGDLQPEGMEAFGLVLSRPVNAVLVDGRGEGLIDDDDGPTPPPRPPGDFNGDGRADLVVAYQALPKAGEPGGREIIWDMHATVAEPTLTSPPLADDGWRVVGTGEFDGEGGPDLLWRHPDLGLVFSFATAEDLAEPDFGSPLAPPPDTTLDALAVGSGDFDGNGWPDLLLWEPATGELRLWYLGRLAIVGSGGTDPPGDGDLAWRPAATGDFDGDGAPDILWRHAAGGALRVWIMDGVKLKSEVTPQPPAASEPEWETVAAGDFDGDGSTDLLWQHAGSLKLEVWFMAQTFQLCSVLLDPDRLDLPGYVSWTIEGPR